VVEAARRHLKIERRSLAMLPPSSPITRDKAIAIIERCQRAIDAVRGRIG
jgi:hypothetical protein